MSQPANEDAKRSVRTLFEAFNHGDLSSMDELVAPEFVGPQGAKGPAALKAVTMDLRAAFPDLHYTVDELFAEEERVAVRWHWTGTHQAPFGALPATGKRLSNSGVGVFRVRHGQIIAADILTDRLGFLQQIGAVPPNLAGPPPGASRPAAR
jgi:steroid delta-isomerase-like uncharacterized protein